MIPTAEFYVIQSTTSLAYLSDVAKSTFLYNIAHAQRYDTVEDTHEALRSISDQFTREFQVVRVGIQTTTEVVPKPKVQKFVIQIKGTSLYFVNFNRVGDAGVDLLTTTDVYQASSYEKGSRQALRDIKDLNKVDVHVTLKLI